MAEPEPFFPREIELPSDLKSDNSDHKTTCIFKNISDQSIDLYWINYDGEPEFYVNLNPMDQIEEGYPQKTYVTHPWVGIYGTKLALLNGSKYFLPPDATEWRNRAFEVLITIQEENVN